MSAAEHLASIKANKLSRWVLSNSWFNHPHRLSGISTSGSLAYTIDERDFTGAGTTAKVYEFALAFGGANGFTRIYEDKVPWRLNLLTPSPPPAGTPAAGEIVLAHRPRRMWAMLSVETAPAAVKIGTCTVTNWSRPTTSDPWVEGSSTETDVDFYFDVAFSEGGEPDSQGKGDGSDDEKVSIWFQENLSGSHTFRLPNFSAFVYRLPWVDSWAAETLTFSTIFTDHLAAENAADGGGHSGTCSLSLDFS